MILFIKIGKVERKIVKFVICFLTIEGHKNPLSEKTQDWGGLVKIVMIDSMRDHIPETNFNIDTSDRYNHLKGIPY